MEPEKQKRDWLLPVSILIAGLMITVALVYNAGKGVVTDTVKSGDFDLSSVAFLGKSDAPLTLFGIWRLSVPLLRPVFRANGAES